MAERRAATVRDSGHDKRLPYSVGNIVGGAWWPSTRLASFDTALACGEASIASAMTGLALDAGRSEFGSCSSWKADHVTLDGRLAGASGKGSASHGDVLEWSKRGKASVGIGRQWGESLIRPLQSSL